MISFEMSICALDQTDSVSSVSDGTPVTRLNREQAVHFLSEQTSEAGETSERQATIKTTNNSGSTQNSIDSSLLGIFLCRCTKEFIVSVFEPRYYHRQITYEKSATPFLSLGPRPLTKKSAKEQSTPLDKAPDNSRAASLQAIAEARSIRGPGNSAD